MPDDEKKNAEAALSRMRAKIEAIPPEQIETCNVAGTHIVAVATRYHENLMVDASLMPTVFVRVPTEAIAEILDRGLAAYGAELRVETLYDTSDTERRQLYAEGGDAKKKSVSVLELVAPSDLEVVGVLTIVRPGTGYADRAKDLSRLHPQLVRYQAEIVRRELMSAAEIDRVGELGALLAVGGPKPRDAEAARLLRNRAWTLFAQAYRELNAHLDFLHRHAPTARGRYPSLYARSPRAAEPRPAEQPPTETPTGTPTA